jgi:hypothetical protein
MMDQVPRIQRLWRVPYSQLLILPLECWIYYFFVTKPDYKTKRKKESRERRKKRRILPKGFPFLCCYGLNRGGVSKSLP